MILKIISLIIIFSNFIRPGVAEFCFFEICVWKREIKPEVKREKTYTEIFFSFFRYLIDYISSFHQELIFIRITLVLSTIGIATIIILLMRAIRGRHRTQTDDRPGKNISSTSQGSVATEFNINNTLRLESNAQTCLRGDNRSTMKRPNEFNRRTDVETWLLQLEIYLEKCCEKKDWFDVTLSHVNATCLKDLPGIGELRNKPDNYQMLREFLQKKICKKDRRSW